MTEESDWKTIPLASAQRPQLLEEEVELRVTQGVCLNQHHKDISSQYLCVLTNYRILLIGEGNAQCCGLVDVLEWEDCAGMFQRSKRITLVFASKREIDMKFHKGGKEQFLVELERAMKRKAWESIAAPQSKQPIAFSVHNAGVGGIIRREERKRQDAKLLASEALGDLDALMERAREAVVVVQRYAAYIQAESKDNGQDNQQSELLHMLQGVGIASPVTKASAGDAYHDQLARQLADLLLAENRLRRLGSILALTDTYCLYNRARGTDLVSPEDLLQAASLLRPLHLGVHLETFPSGVKAVVLDDFSFDRLAAKMRQYASEHGHGVHVLQMGKYLGISSVLAKEYMMQAEEIGILCRDESPEGLLFFPNIFNDFL